MILLTWIRIQSIRIHITAIKFNKYEFLVSFGGIGIIEVGPLFFVVVIRRAASATLPPSATRLTAEQSEPNI